MAPTKPLRPDYPIRTDRLDLRPFAASDLEDIYDIYRRPDVVRYLYHEPCSRSEARSLLDAKVGQAEVRGEGERLTLAVTEAGRPGLIGDVTLAWRSEQHAQGEIGYVFHPDQQGRGYATEAASAMIDLGFGLLGLHRIEARCDADNPGSERVMVRLGMRKEAHFVHNEVFKGAWGSELVYAVLADEWATRRGSGPAGSADRAPGRPTR